jgi:hypothetical protein
MKKVNKNKFLTIGIILVIIIISYFSLTKPTPETDQEIIQCIGQKSVLYVQLGCSHCKTQEELFGDNLQYINLVDCFYENEKCIGIKGTPTWIIKGEQYVGVQSINKLQELTNC